MRPVTSPDSLLVEAEKLAGIGGTGFLLSGGCDGRGRVPLHRFVEAVATAKQRWGLRVNLHPGLLDFEEAAVLAGSGADSYSVDLHQSERVIRDVLHLDAPSHAYSETIKALQSSVAGSVTPHITVGLDEDGEDAFASVELASELGVSSLVVLVFTPLRETSMGAMRPPSEGLVLRVLKEARSKIDGPVSLGCMRPRGSGALEVSAIKAGLRDIAMPTREAIEWAGSHGLKVEHIERCCAVHL